MTLQKTPVERVELDQIETGTSIVITGATVGRVVELGVDIFNIDELYLYGAGSATRNPRSAAPGRDEDLTDRFYRLPVRGIIEAGDVYIDSVPGKTEMAGQLAGLPNSEWIPLKIGGATLQLWRNITE